MNLLMPTILPDNTEVNGKMKMKCLNVNGSNITEIITGPKITYRSGERDGVPEEQNTEAADCGERSFLKSISIDGYRLTISYIDDLFKGATVECNLRRNGVDVIYVKLYPNGEVNIKGEAYTSVNTSWKSISFNISVDIQDGYIRLLRSEDMPRCDFDFILPPPSEHTLYSSFISDMKYITRNTRNTRNTEQITPEAQRTESPAQSANTENSRILNAEIQKLNDRLDELENKLRKFGIE